MTEAEKALLGRLEKAIDMTSGRQHEGGALYTNDVTISLEDACELRELLRKAQS